MLMNVPRIFRHMIDAVFDFVGVAYRGASVDEHFVIRHAFHEAPASTLSAAHALPFHYFPVT